jgi:hypothetical protein
MIARGMYTTVVETTLVMEKVGPPQPSSCRLIHNTAAAPLQKQLAEAADQGSEVVDFAVVVQGERIALLRHGGWSR